jgi:hypothetical protein
MLNTYTHYYSTSSFHILLTEQPLSCNHSAAWLTQLIKRRNKHMTCSVQSSLGGWQHTGQSGGVLEPVRTFLRPRSPLSRCAGDQQDWKHVQETNPSMNEKNSLWLIAKKRGDGPGSRVHCRYRVDTATVLVPRSRKIRSYISSPP